MSKIVLLKTIQFRFAMTKYLFLFYLAFQYIHCIVYYL